MKKKILTMIGVIVVALVAVGFWLYRNNGPKIPGSDMKYGVSFGITRSNDMKINWKDAYGAVLNDLKPKRLRLIADWPLMETKEGAYDFKDMDYQMQQAASHHVQVVLAVGRRVPGYPECHDPAWLAQYPISKQEELDNRFVTAVVSRYKSNPALNLWQVENEPYFNVFTRFRNLCPVLDTAAFAKEIALVRDLDPAHKIIITDAGEVGTWYGAYRSGDVFGTSTYLYVWNGVLGFIHYPLGPWYFRIKLGLMKLLFGDKPAVVIELQSEPWTPRPLVEVPIDEQLTHFDMAKMNELIGYPYQSGFDTAYLWGAEWWYWMKLNDHPEFWQRAQQVFAGSQ